MANQFGGAGASGTFGTSFGGFKPTAIKPVKNKATNFAGSMAGLPQKPTILPVTTKKTTTPMQSTVPNMMSTNTGAKPGYVKPIGGMSTVPNMQSTATGPKPGVIKAGPTVPGMSTVPAKTTVATTPKKTTPAGTVTATAGTVTATNTDTSTETTTSSPDIEFGGTKTTTTPEGTTTTPAETETPDTPEGEVTPPDYVGQDIALSQAEYMQKSKEEEEFQRQQRGLQVQVDTLSGEMSQLQSSELIRKTSDDLDRLKHNIAYLGKQGQPGDSAVKMEAISKQVSEAETVFKNLKRLETDKESMRTLGLEYDAASFERQMVQMQNNLNSNVNAAIQEAMNGLNAEEMAGKLDTIEEVEALRGTLFQNLDKAIAGKIVANATDRKLIIDRYNQTIATTEAFVKNKSTVNKDMSTALGYYVDGNGNPVLNAQGVPITMPKEAPMDPIFDKDSGSLLTFSTGADGKIVTTVQKILAGTQAAGEPRKQASDGSYYRTNAQGVLETSGTGTAKTVTTTERLAIMKAYAAGEIDESTKNSMLGGGGYGTTGGGATTPVSGYTGPNYTAASVDKVQAAFTQATAQGEGSRGGQCGAFVNDYLQNMGIGRLFTDPIDKKKAVTNSTQPTVGSIAIMDSYSKPQYGHVGIVTSVNADGTVTLKQSNKDGSEKIFTSKVNASSIYGYFDPQIPQSEAMMSGGGTTTEDDGEITIDDITSFNDAVERRKMKSADVNRIGEAKKAVMTDPNADVEDIMAWSQGGKTIGETQSKSFIKFDQAIAGLTAVQKEIKKMKTGPIIGKLKSINPYDTNAQTLKTMLQGLVPTLARGVYGEVGVLTDSDVRLYAKTLPNLQSTKDVNKAVLAYTLDVLAGGYKSQLKSLAGQGYDVSGMSGMYNDIKGQADLLRNELGMGQSTTTNNNINTSGIGRRQSAQ